MGTLKLPKNNPIEKLHLRFCKELLGVQTQMTNCGVLLELGQIPLELFAVKNAIKNWVRISGNGKANELVKISYNFSLIKQLSWVSQMELRLASIGQLESFITKDHLSDTKAFQRMTDIFYQNTFATIREGSSKLRTYGKLKNTREIEKYLLSNIKEKQRISMTKLRLSNHELLIEKGRRMNIDKNLRFCPFCPTKIASEMHFMMECGTYSTLRNTMMQDMIIMPHLSTLAQDKIFIALLSDTRLIHTSANFIQKAFELRKFLLNRPRNDD